MLKISTNCTDLFLTKKLFIAGETRPTFGQYKFIGVLCKACNNLESLVNIY